MTLAGAQATLVSFGGDLELAKEIVRDNVRAAQVSDM